jgi:hypothetical protein
MSQTEREDLLEMIVREEEANPPDMTAALSIPRYSEVGVALQDLERTAYVPEGQFRFVQPGAQQFLATFGICNCIAVFATSPGQTAFCTHINPGSFVWGLEEFKFRKKVGGGGVVSIFKTMSDALTTAFKDVKTSSITVSLVGGWKLADHHKKWNLDKIFKNDKGLRLFSTVVLKCVKDALPGAKIDTSYLNRFDGISWTNRTIYSKHKKIANGESYDVAALDILTGQIHLQTSAYTRWLKVDETVDNGFILPMDIAEDVHMHSVGEIKRSQDALASLRANKMPTPVLHEYIDCGVNERVQWPDILDC